MREVLMSAGFGILFYCLVMQVVQCVTEGLTGGIPEEEAEDEKIIKRRKPMLDTIRLRVLHTACMTVEEIADKLNSTPIAVEEALKNMGYTPIYTKPDVEPNEFVKKRSNMPKGKKTPPEKIAEIRDLRAQGQTLREIAKNTGIPYKTVQGYCLKAAAPSAQKEKEPAPTDIGASPKENNHNTSITDNSENVNTTEEIPEIVLKALTDTLEDLYGHKREIIEVIENLKNRLEIERRYLGEIGKDITDLRKYIRSIGYNDVLTAIDGEQKRRTEADA